NKFTRINDDFYPAIVIIEIEIQDQNARLCSDQYAHFVGDHQSVGTADLLDVKKQYDAFPQALEFSRFERTQESQVCYRVLPDIIGDGLILDDTAAIPCFDVRDHGAFWMYPPACDARGDLSGSFFVR